MDLIWQREVERCVQRTLCSDMNSRLYTLPSAKVLSIKQCIDDVFNQIRFSSDVVCEVMASREDEISIRAVAYVKVGKSFRPILLSDSVESCKDMTARDVVALICAFFEEVEYELICLTEENVHIATVQDLQFAWSTNELPKEM
ncbi:hypothetical protein AAC03nite_28650 [Alicyclobacillus acidoterrestris]|uniref:hypothetical protein n=1 Tax=Alicyclobacillus suci TaxID=2816080 RepID=UPI00118FF591|nr:hypothetical protein [Alicyclobacillus suci]GEO27080.1 hypothetical protein AAC03nite_28650 [Alicyclobacillus acidoterrestris]